MTTLPRRPVLGRGLSALIPDAGPTSTTEAPPRTAPEIPIEEIQPSTEQPRTVFDDAAIEELAASIRENGVIQPVIVRQTGPHQYVLIAGERRWRAAGRAGLKKLPAVVRDVTPDVAYQLALIENVQRQDLRPLEEAEAYRHLLEMAHLTQDELARRVGKDRATIANALRLLRLPPDLKMRVESGALTAGHIRALLTLPDETAQRALAVRVEAEGLSVRETERLARSLRAETAAEPAPATTAGVAASAPITDHGTSTHAPAATPNHAPPPARKPAVEALEQQLRAALGAPVALVYRGGAGRIEIKFHSLDELQRLVDLMAHLEGL